MTFLPRHKQGYVKDVEETKAKIAEEQVAETAALEKLRAFEEQTSDARQALEVRRPITSIDIDSSTNFAQNARGDMEEIVTKVAKQGAVMNMVKDHRQKVMQKHQEIAKRCHVGGALCRPLAVR